MPAGGPERLSGDYPRRDAARAAVRDRFHAQRAGIWPGPGGLSAAVIPAALWLCDDPAQFERVVRLLFSQRRKQIASTLRGTLDAAQIRHAGLDPHIRPERLAVTDFVALSDAAGPVR